MPDLSVELLYQSTHLLKMHKPQEKLKQEQKTKNKLSQLYRSILEGLSSLCSFDFHSYPTHLVFVDTSASLSCLKSSLQNIEELHQKGFRPKIILL